MNVTLLFSRSQYAAAAEAYLRGVERRIAAGLNPNVASVASVFVSRWDTTAAGKVPEKLRNQLGIAIAQSIYREYRSRLSSDRWRRAGNGAFDQPEDDTQWFPVGISDGAKAATFHDTQFVICSEP